MIKLKWHRTRDSYTYYAKSPVNDFVFIAYDQRNQWSNHIIFKKHLHLIENITDYLNVDDLTLNDNRQQNIIDCACLRLKGSKHEFQNYVDNFSNLEKHSFNFYKLKDYVGEVKQAKKKYKEERV